MHIDLSLLTRSDVARLFDELGRPGDEQLAQLRALHDRLGDLLHEAREALAGIQANVGVKQVDIAAPLGDDPPDHHATYARYCAAVAEYNEKSRQLDAQEVPVLQAAAKFKHIREIAEEILTRSESMK